MGAIKIYYIFSTFYFLFIVFLCKGSKLAAVKSGPKFTHPSIHAYSPQLTTAIFLDLVKHGRIHLVVQKLTSFTFSYSFMYIWLFLLFFFLSLHKYIYTINNYFNSNYVAVEFYYLTENKTCKYFSVKYSM